MLSDWDKRIISDYRNSIARYEAAIEGKSENELVRPVIGDSPMRPVWYWRNLIAKAEQEIAWIEANPSN